MSGQRHGLGRRALDMFNLSRYLASEPGSRALQVAGFLRFALLFVQGIILVKAGVALSLIGQIELVFFVSNFMIFYWLNGGRNAMLSWVPQPGLATDIGKLTPVFASMHLCALIASALFAGIVHLPLGEEYALLRENALWLWLLAYVFFTISSSPMTIVYLFRGKLTSLLWFEGISTGLNVIVVLATILITRDIHLMAQCLAIYALMRYVFVLLAGPWMGKNRTQLRGTWAFFGFAVPLILYSLSGGLTDYVDGYIVTYFFGDEQFALYRFGAREFPVNVLLIGGLVSGLIATYRGGGDVDAPGLKQEISRLMRSLFPLNLFLILFSPFLFTLVYDDAFILSARIFNIYALTLISRVIINQVYLYVFHHNWVLMGSTVVEFLVNIALSIVLLREFGLIGVPMATAIAYALHKLFLIVYVGRWFRSPLSSYLPVRQYLLYLAAMGACYTLTEILFFQ